MKTRTTILVGGEPKDVWEIYSEECDLNCTYGFIFDDREAEEFDRLVTTRRTFGNSGPMRVPSRSMWEMPT
jgi:hypothetical protein